MRRIVLAAVASALLLSACGGGDGDEAKDGQTQLTVRLDGVYAGQHVPILAGIEEGFYADAGIDLVAEVGTGSANALKTVAAGTDDIGFVDSGVLAQGVEKDIPVKSFFGYLQKSPFVIVARADKGIKTLDDLVKGKGSFAIGSSNEGLFPVLAKLNGLPLDKIMDDAIEVSKPATRDSLFISGKVDWTFKYLPSVDKMATACDCDVNTILFSDYGVNVLSNGMIASTKLIESNPEALTAFSEATRKAIEWSIENPEDAARDFLKYAPDAGLSEKDVLTGWKAAMTLLKTDGTNDKPYGCTIDEDWSTTTSFMVEVGSLAKQPDNSTLYTNDLLGTTC